MTIKIRKETFSEMKFPGLMDFIFPLIFHCGQDHLVRTIVATLWSQQESGSPYSEQIMEQLFQAMMIYIHQQYHTDMHVLIPGSAQDMRMLEILSYMLDHYQTATLQSVAEHFHYSPAYLSRMFHQQNRTTFSALLREFKLRQAAKLLQETKLKLNNICEIIGYKDCTQFIANFKALYGETPAKFRKRYLSGELSSSEKSP